MESGLLEIDHIRGHVDILAHCYAQVEREHIGVEAKFLFNEALQLMQNVLTDDLIATTLENTQAIGATTLEQVREHPARLATFSALAEAHRLQEKRYLYDTLYTCEELSLEHDKAEEVVTALFDFWINEPRGAACGLRGRDRDGGTGARGCRLYCRHDRQLHPAAVCADQARGAAAARRIRVRPRSALVHPIRSTRSNPMSNSHH